MSIRIAVGGIVHETNTFASLPTGITEFEANLLLRGTEFERLAGTNTVIGGVLAEANDRQSIELVPLITASAIPGGIVTRDAFESVVGELESGLSSQAIDAVVLDLHGALVAEGHPGGDGEVARRVRAIVGPDVPIVAVLDLHGNLDQRLVDSIDIILPYDTYPHVDNAERGREALDLVARSASGEITPVTRAVKLSISPPGPNQFSNFEPTVSFQNAAREWESQPGVLNVGILFAFPYSDVPHNGMAIVATTDGDPALAERICEEMGELIRSRYLEFWPDMMTVEEAVHAAMEDITGPIVLADYGDNPGGGTSADGTALLWALLDLGAEGAAIAVICDPEVVAVAIAAGVGAEIEVELGGKLDNWHGAPIPLSARVINLTNGDFTYEGPIDHGVTDTLGRTAVLGCTGRHGNIVEVIVCERRVQALDTAIFRSQGIDPTSRKILVVKSSVHFRASFMPIASRIILVNTPGLLQLDVSAFPFEHIHRPMWPHDADEPRIIKMY